MNSAIERLLTLRVADVMSTGVTTVSTHATMAEAARLMCEHNIRGLPAVDEQDRCVGILTATDFVIRENRARNLEHMSAQDDYRLRPGNGDAAVRVDYSPEDRVDKHMTSAVQSIDQNQPMMEAARYMSMQHVHRLVALDESSRPVGIITSLDLVAALIKAVEE